MTGKTSDINRTLISSLDKSKQENWADCLDRRQVWNQKRPPWLEAIIHLVYPVLDPIALMLISAMQTGASNYQSMVLAITCFCEMWDAVPDSLFNVTACLIEILPADIKPLGDSLLIQILFCALYTKFLECGAAGNEKDPPPETDASTSDHSGKSKATICQILAENVCAIDEDNKHTELLQGLVNLAAESQKRVRIESEEDETGLSLASTSKVEDESTPGKPSMTRPDEEYDVENADYISEVYF